VSGIENAIISSDITVLTKDLIFFYISTTLKTKLSQDHLMSRVRSLWEVIFEQGLILSGAPRQAPF